MRDKIASDLRFSFFDMFLISVVGYLLYVIVGKFLSPIEYGVFMSIMTVYIATSPLTTLGFTETMVPLLKISFP